MRIRWLSEFASDDEQVLLVASGLSGGCRASAAGPPGRPWQWPRATSAAGPEPDPGSRLVTGPPRQAPARYAPLSYSIWPSQSARTAAQQCLSESLAP